MSLIQSAKLNGHDPHTYLKDVLTRLLTHMNSRLEELRPHLGERLSVYLSTIIDCDRWAISERINRKSRLDGRTLTRKSKFDRFEIFSKNVTKLRVLQC